MRWACLPHPRLAEGLERVEHLVWPGRFASSATPANGAELLARSQATGEKQINPMGSRGLGLEAGRANRDGRQTRDVLLLGQSGSPCEHNQA
jgi:hypothetical protein